MIILKECHNKYNLICHMIYLIILCDFIGFYVRIIEIVDEIKSVQ